jgi:alpha-L-fucosidase
VGSNHHRRPFPGEDFQMFEKDLPGQKSSSFNDQSEIGDLPLEMCETMNGAWGFNLLDTRYKSTKELVQLLVKAAGYDANLLLNVGPMPNGRIQPEFVSRLQDMGRWLSKSGEAIYGTRGGPVPPRPWGVTTKKADKVYVHVLDSPDPVLALPRLPRPVTGAHRLGGAPVAVAASGDAVSLTIGSDRDPLDTVIVLELAGK